MLVEVKQEIDHAITTSRNPAIPQSRSALTDPRQVRGVAVDDGKNDELGDVVGMERADALPQRDQPRARGLDQQLALALAIDLPFPLKDGFHDGQQIHAGSQPIFYE